MKILCLKAFWVMHFMHLYEVIGNLGKKNYATNQLFFCGQGYQIYFKAIFMTFAKLFLL